MPASESLLPLHRGLRASYRGLTVNDGAVKNTGTMNQDAVILKTCTGVVQTESLEHNLK